LAISRIISRRNTQSQNGVASYTIFTKWKLALAGG